MDTTLTASFNPLSQMSYVPTYQVGSYNTAQASSAAQMMPAAISFDSQPNAAGVPQPGRPAANAQHREIGYFGSSRKRFVALKVAQAADAVPE